MICKNESTMKQPQTPVIRHWMFLEILLDFRENNSESPWLSIRFYVNKSATELEFSLYTLYFKRQIVVYIQYMTSIWRYAISIIFVICEASWIKARNRSKKAHPIPITHPNEPLVNLIDGLRIKHSRFKETHPYQ